MRVDVSGYQFIFPAQCACCGGQPQTTLTVAASKSTGKRVVHTTTKTWDFPYCVGCITHVKAANNAVTAAATISILSVIAGAYGYFYTAASIIGILLAIIGIAAAVIIYSKMMAQAKALCGSQCACVNRAVNYHGWQGTCQSFEIASSSYALIFMTANQRKLVNVTPEVWQWLHSNGIGQQQHRPQSAKRYIK